MLPPHFNKQRHKELLRMALWEGQMSRRRVIQALGATAIRASQRIRELRDELPHWFSWDSKTRSYLTTAIAYQEAEKDLVSEDSDLQLSAYLAESDIYPDLAAKAGQVSIAPWGFSQVKPYIFSRLRLAIDGAQRIELIYRSMRHPEPHVRTVEPHSIVKAGRRWHLRGYCIEVQGYRDFVLGRIVRATVLNEASLTTADEDLEWSQVVPVRLQAHPRLNEGQREVVGMECFEGAAARVLRCRGALVPYLAQELRLATNLERDHPPEFQLAVENIEEVSKWLFP